MKIQNLNNIKAVYTFSSVEIPNGLLSHSHLYIIFNLLPVNYRIKN